MYKSQTFQASVKAMYTFNSQLTKLTLVGLFTLNIATFIHYNGSLKPTHLQQLKAYFNRMLHDPLTSPPVFRDEFPDKHLVYDMMQLCADVFKVEDDRLSPQDAITNPKYKFEDYFHAPFSTVGMIVSIANNKTTTKQHTKSYQNQTAIPIIIFRGSDNLQDWTVDFDVMMETSKFPNAPSDVKCHKGFQDALFEQDVVTNIENKVVRLIGDEGNVIFTGHSLGAANAHITATYMADKYPKMNITTINFGSPRLGNRAFKTWTEEKLPNLAVWRFVNKDDVVPRVVSRTWGYIHAGHLYQLNKRNGLVYYRQNGDRFRYKGAPFSWYGKWLSLNFLIL